MKVGELKIGTSVCTNVDILSGMPFDLNAGSGLIDALSVLIVKLGGNVIYDTTEEQEESL